MKRNKAKVEKLGTRVLVHKGETDIKKLDGSSEKNADGSVRKLQVWTQVGDIFPNRAAASAFAKTVNGRTHVEGVRVNIEPLAGGAFEFNQDRPRGPRRPNNARPAGRP